MAMTRQERTAALEIVDRGVISISLLSLSRAPRDAGIEFPFEALNGGNTFWFASCIFLIDFDTLSACGLAKYCSGM
jgi:hypothetical protein